MDKNKGKGLLEKALELCKTETEKIFITKKSRTLMTN
jgi:hypothetical protein